MVPWQSMGARSRQIPRLSLKSALHYYTKRSTISAVTYIYPCRGAQASAARTASQLLRRAPPLAVGRVMRCEERAWIRPSATRALWIILLAPAVAGSMQTRAGAAHSRVHRWVPLLLLCATDSEDKGAASYDWDAAWREKAAELAVTREADDASSFRFNTEESRRAAQRVVHLRQRNDFNRVLQQLSVAAAAIFGTCALTYALMFLTYFPGTSAFAEGLGIHGLDSIDQNAFARNVLHTGMYGVVVVPLVVVGFWRRGSVLGFERLFRLLGERDRDETRE